MQHHQSHKNLKHDFDAVWERLKVSGRQSLQTPDFHNFDAFATLTTRGSHQGKKVIRIMKDGKEFARIYPCCWRHSTNCHGTRIGGYSEALDQWAL
jgi:hypothetical protein